MLYLKQDFDNLVLMSLLDRTSYAYPPNGVTATWSYLFNFTNDMTKESTTTIIIPNAAVSSDKKWDGSNDIMLRLRDLQTSTPDNLHGEVKLYPKGYWSYEVYEQDSVSNTTIDGLRYVNHRKLQVGKAYVYNNTDEVQYTEHIETPPATNYMYVK